MGLDGLSSSACGPPPALEPPEEACDPQPAPDPSQVTLGSCDGSWRPPGYVRETSTADTDAIVALVGAWITGEDSPGIDVARGIVYAKPDDDSGRSGPYPSFVPREASVECGRHALWLRNSMQLDFRARAMPGSEGVRCTKNICCYQASGEFDSSGTIVFEMIREERPVLRAVAIVADNGTLSHDVVSKQRAWMGQGPTRGPRARQVPG